MHDALGNPLPVELGKLLDQVMVMQQHRALRTRGQRLVVTLDRDSGIRCGAVGHEKTSPLADYLD
ncbi:Uncharacterised protein [Mycobacteroides abscessus subsp. abscessus]|nr:Uncharacterised protein [Mycobacteroides abscessus subsp. abscessus]